MSKKCFTSFLLVISCILIGRMASAYGAISEFYFSEKDGAYRVIAYKAVCIDYAGKAECSLKAISIGNTKSTFQCTMTVERLIDSEKAMRSGDVWTVSRKAGLCDYTHTYQFSKGGMVQIKSSPRKAKSKYCQVFDPKTYNMKSHKLYTEIKFNTKGCDTISINGFQ